jgi:membrane-associated phospholipid phosphatase
MQPVASHHFPRIRRYRRSPSGSLACEGWFVDVLHRFDDQLFMTVNDWARSSPGLHGVFLAYGKYGLVVFAAFLLVGLAHARHQGAPVLAMAGWTCMAVLVALAVNQPVGHLVGEARPYITHPGVLVLADPTTDYAFPSDHAVMAGAASAGLLLVWRRLGMTALAAALLMAFTRVYIGAHYPWDVAAGLLLGAFVTLTGWALLRYPLIVLVTWLRGQAGVRAVFAPTS